MNFRTIFKNFKIGYQDPSVKSNYLWAVAGIGITGSLYALGFPEIVKYSAIATTGTLATANAIKQYGRGTTILKNIEI